MVYTIRYFKIFLVSLPSMSKIKFDKYGEAILNDIEHGTDNLVVNAVAGAGKTTIIVEACCRLPKDINILIVAFNKSIEEELTARIELAGLRNVTIYTYHALGKSVIEENNAMNLPEVNSNKYKTRLIEYLNEKGTHTFATMGKARYISYYNNIVSLIDFARFSLSETIDDVRNCALRYSINVIDDECEVVLEMLKWGRSNLAKIDYADMIWLPFVLDYQTSKKFDFVFIDEAQDTSPAQQHLARKTFKETARFAACGDNHQTINSWCGADKDAFASFLKIPNTHSYPLPVCWRCPKKVVELAQKIVPYIESQPNAIEGEVLYDVKPSAPVTGDMVLCRTNEPLARLYAYYLEINKKAYIKGGDLDVKLLEMLENTNKQMLHADLSKDGVFAELYRTLFKMIEDAIKKDNITERDAIFSKEIDNFYNNIKSLEILSKGLQTKKELIDKFKVIFSDNNEDGVMLSTIHKAKGLDRDNVYILGRSLMPSRLAKQPWEMEAEKDLEYVAYTRAIKTLSFISEKEFPVNDAFSHPEVHINILNEIETIVNRLALESTAEDDIPVITSATTKTPPKRKIGGLKYGKFM